MHHGTSSLQQNSTISPALAARGSTTAVDRLNVVFRDADDAIRAMHRSWQDLMTQLAEVEHTIAFTTQQARRLDAFVDDALYAGDAAAARCCAERAKKLRLELARITEQFNSNKRLAELMHANVRSLEVDTRING
jgi:phage shock protein A